MKIILITTILFISFTFGTIHSQDFNKQKLDSLFNTLSEKNKAMGSFIISKNGTILYNKTIGYSYISNNKKKLSTETTVYRIGSISKLFTATMIFQLIEEGKIKLSMTLDTYFPNLPNANQITIGNLLNHRSGLHDFTRDSDYTNWMTQPKSHDEMVTIISKRKVDFEPNEKASYSNPNYIILGYIIEKICKEPYSKVLYERISSKIGLTNTYYGGKINPKKNESYSYKWMDKWEQQPEKTDMSIPGGAGSIVSTPTDLTKFIEALFSLKLVTQNSLNQMKTITDGYGMGMGQVPFYTKTAIVSNGSIDGFVSTLVYFPEDSLAAAYCTNGEVYPMNEILIGAMSIYFDQEYLLPVFNSKPAITISPENLDKYLGSYSSAKISLKIIITKEKSALILQASGQKSFSLEAIDKDKFQFIPAGIEIEFNTDRNEFTMKQHGRTFLFTKDK